MRGKLGPILSGVGGFLLVVGLLLKFYAYPNLAVAPVEQDTVSQLSGAGATVFDIPSLSEIQVDLTTTAKTTGDVKASQDAGDDIRVWENATSTKSDDDVVRSRSIERVAFDAHTGEAVECEECGTYSETVQGQPEAVDFEGQIFKFPFQTEKKTYQWWDSTLLRAFPAEYVREEKLEGLETYVFEQVIEPEVWTQMEVPPDVVGEEGEDSIEADRSYSNTRTFWVEPETGVVIKRQEQQGATLQIDGEDRATLTEVTTTFTDDTIANNVDEYGAKVTQLKMIRSTLPLVLGILGALLLVLGFVLHRRSQGSSRTESPAQAKAKANA
ncbi:DUF3068 domain-containing protein [Nocardioides campestrisoli]|uniref:DUF3068 domain-containing protein n=1 Tax=Nocardioides campestrisoli TaxID=2736757 RepID=UPI0028126370|nr:DUF3068 domain-containing protein [Nocardioides campestrisoli]